ncbi:hypothetical protein, partial [Sphingomonas sp.]|uniref:hypothetical protein n=1 Tax=Sphingomonas sp. TaxID=28214 RepID=UPI002587C812
VRIVVDPGPLYTLRSIAVRDPRGAPFPDEVLPERFTRVDADVPARSATVLAREARIVDRFRALGHPFAKAVSRDPVVDDAAHVMDVTYTVDPGPIAGLGEVAVRGTRDIDPAVVRSFIYAEPGDPYSPKAVADIRRSVASGSMPTSTISATTSTRSSARRPASIRTASAADSRPPSSSRPCGAPATISSPTSSPAARRSNPTSPTRPAARSP